MKSGLAVFFLVWILSLLDYNKTMRVIFLNVISPSKLFNLSMSLRVKTKVLTTASKTLYNLVSHYLHDLISYHSLLPLALAILASFVIFK